jgi:hypothetical protein
VAANDLRRHYLLSASLTTLEGRADELYELVPQLLGLPVSLAACGCKTELTRSTLAENGHSLGQKIHQVKRGSTDLPAVLLTPCEDTTLAVATHKQGDILAFHTLSTSAIGMATFLKIDTMFVKKMAPLLLVI